MIYPHSTRTNGNISCLPCGGYCFNIFEKVCSEPCHKGLPHQRRFVSFHPATIPVTHFKATPEPHKIGFCKVFCPKYSVLPRRLLLTYIFPRVVFTKVPEKDFLFQLYSFGKQYKGFAMQKREDLLLWTGLIKVIFNKCINTV